MAPMQGSRTTDPYAVLGVPRDATSLQVARAHRRLAKEHHPDLQEGDERRAEAADRMRRINEAWAVLSDPDARAAYDRSHPSAGTPRAGHWAPSRASISPSQPSSTRSWATWRATAAETRSAPRTMRQPGEMPVPRTRRPPRARPRPATFRDSGWAAAIAAAAIILMLLGAVALGRLAL
jgi:curved DNA-binding protein CbpA